MSNLGAACRGLVLVSAFMGACDEAAPPPIDPPPVTPAVAPAPPEAPEAPLAKAPPTRAERIASIVARSVAPSEITSGDRGFEDAPLYDLELDYDDELSTYRGRETVDFVNAGPGPLTTLKFLMYPNTSALTEGASRNLSVRDVRVDGAPARFGMKGEHLDVTLPAPLPAGASAVVSMAFNGVVFRLPQSAADPQKMALDQLLGVLLDQGGKKGGYGVFAVGEDIVSLALWYPILVAHDEAGWDVAAGGAVGDVSYFDVSHVQATVTVADDVTVVATGIETGTTGEAGRTTHTFQAGAVREFTVQLSKTYDVARGSVDGVQVSSYFPRDARDAGERVLRHARDAVRVYQDLYGPYPYRELDLCAAPLVGGAGGVEFPGLVTIASMFYGTGSVNGMKPPVDLSKSKYMRETMEFVVAHEVAHQWWNAVVGSDSKRHPFVDEALANHSAVRYFEVVHGAAAADRQRDLQLRLGYQLARLTGARDRPVDLPTADYDGMLEYAATVYGKGALFFDAARAQVGPVAFDRFVRAYYRQFAFRIARPGDLVEGLALASTDPASMQALAERWLRGTHGDEDVGPLEISKVLQYLVGTISPAQLEALGLDPKLVALLDGEGIDELAKVLRSLLDPDAPAEQVDYAAILALTMQLLEGEEAEVRGLAQAAGRVLARRGGRIDMKDAPRVLLDVGREMVGDDKDARLMIDAADLLIQYMEAPDSTRDARPIRPRAGGRPPQPSGP